MGGPEREGDPPKPTVFTGLSPHQAGAGPLKATMLLSQLSCNGRSHLFSLPDRHHRGEGREGGDTGQGSQEVTSMLNSAPYPHVIWDGRTAHEASVSITVEPGSCGGRLAPSTSQDP